jgi:hypothetical protein
MVEAFARVKEAGAEDAAGTLSFTSTRHLLQYRSPGLIGLPQAVQSRVPPAGAAAGAGAGEAACVVGAGAGTGEGAEGIVSFTITRHLLQYFSPGRMGLPQAVQSRVLPARVPAAGVARLMPTGAPQEPQNFVPETNGVPQEGQIFEGGEGICTTTGAGSTGGASIGIATWAGAGAAGGAGSGASPARIPQAPQNCSSGASGLEQLRQRGLTGSGTGVGAGPGVSSVWEAPQFRQNFALAATGFPHSGQNGIRDHATVITPTGKKGLLSGVLGYMRILQRRRDAAGGAYCRTRASTASKFSSVQ